MTWVLGESRCIGVLGRRAEGWKSRRVDVSWALGGGGAVVEISGGWGS